LVVLKDRDGVPFDLRVTGTTHIMAANNARCTRRELANDVGRKASVKLVPERSGDVARDIHLEAS
jgi:propanediol dehydratase small subunit